MAAAVATPMLVPAAQVHSMSTSGFLALGDMRWMRGEACAGVGVFVTL